MLHYITTRFDFYEANILSKLQPVTLFDSGSRFFLRTGINNSDINFSDRGCARSNTVSRIVRKIA